MDRARWFERRDNKSRLANFGTTATLRGLPTSVTKAVGSGSAVITTYTDYNDLGSATVATDGNRNLTTYSNGAENEFVSTITQPTTNGLKHTDLYVHDTNTGLLTAHTDQNNIVNRYTYDSLMRPLLIDSAPGALDAVGLSAESKTSYSYLSATEVQVAQDQNLTGDGKLQSSSVCDGLGRAIKAVARDGSVVEISYDSLNHVCAVSNPSLRALGEIPSGPRKDPTAIPTALPDSFQKIGQKLYASAQSI